MRKIAIISLLIISLATQAQLNFFVEGSANFSLISNSKATNIIQLESSREGYNFFKREQYFADYKNKPGGGVTVGLQYLYAEDNISFDAGIDFTMSISIKQLRKIRCIFTNLLKIK